MRFGNLRDEAVGDKKENTMMGVAANERPGVDAGWLVLFAFQRPWPRATQAGCYAS